MTPSIVSSRNLLGFSSIATAPAVREVAWVGGWKIKRPPPFVLYYVISQCGACPEPNFEIIPCDPSLPIMERTDRLVWVWCCWFLVFSKLLIFKSLPSFRDFALKERSASRTTGSYISSILMPCFSPYGAIHTSPGQAKRRPGLVDYACAKP